MKYDPVAVGLLAEHYGVSLTKIRSLLREAEKRQLMKPDGELTDKGLAVLVKDHLDATKTRSLEESD